MFADRSPLKSRRSRQIIRQRHRHPDQHGLSLTPPLRATSLTLVQSLHRPILYQLAAPTLFRHAGCGHYQPGQIFSGLASIKVATGRITCLPRHRSDEFLRFPDVLAFVAIVVLCVPFAVFALINHEAAAAWAVWAAFTAPLGPR